MTYAEIEEWLREYESTYEFPFSFPEEEKATRLAKHVAMLRKHFRDERQLELVTRYGLLVFMAPVIIALLFCLFDSTRMMGGFILVGSFAIAFFIWFANALGGVFFTKH